MGKFSIFRFSVNGARICCCTKKERRQGHRIKCYVAYNSDITLQAKQKHLVSLAKNEKRPTCQLRCYQFRKKTTHRGRQKRTHVKEGSEGHRCPFRTFLEVRGISTRKRRKGGKTFSDTLHDVEEKGERKRGFGNLIKAFFSVRRSRRSLSPFSPLPPSLTTTLLFPATTTTSIKT